MPKLDVAMAITRHTDTGQFLVIKKDPDAYGGRYDVTPWEVPGGKVGDTDFAACNTPRDSHEHGALPDDVVRHAAIRELSEETALTGEPVRQAAPYHSVQQEDHDDRPTKDIRFYPVLLETNVRDVTLDDSHEHVDHAWITEDDLEAYLTEHELRAFERLDLV